MTNPTAQNLEDQLLAQAHNNIASTQLQIDEVKTELSGEVAPYSVQPQEIPLPDPRPTAQNQRVLPSNQVPNLTINNNPPQQIAPVQIQTHDYSEILDKISLLEKELKNAQKIEAQISPLKNQLTYVQEENAQLEEELRDKDKTISKLSEQIDLYANMQDSLFKMRYQLKQTQEEAEKLRDRYQRSDAQLKHTKENFKTLNSSLNEAQEQSSKLQKELNEREEALEKIKKEVETNLNPELSKYKSKVKEQESKVILVNSLTQSIDSLHQSVEEMRKKNLTLITQSESHRDSISEERMQMRKMKSEYQEIYAELVTLSVEYMRQGSQLPIIDPEIREKLQTWSLEHLIDEAIKGNISRKEFTTILRSFDSQKDMKVVLKNIGQIKLPAPKGKEYSINEILSYNPKSSKSIPVDKIGLFKFLY
jgi:predicted nuclease with TOPRIM domain